MQRFWSIATIVFLCLSQLAPTALATAVAVNPHACCLRATAQHQHCGVSQAGISAQPQCHHGCPSVSFSSSARRLPSARPLADVPHDPQHRPVEGAVVTVHSATSDWSETASSNGLGEFGLNNVPLGRYLVSVSAPGFSANDQEIAVSSSSTVEIHFALQVATLEQKV